MFIKITSFFIHRILLRRLLGQLLSDGCTALHRNIMLKDVLSVLVGEGQEPGREQGVDDRDDGVGGEQGRGGGLAGQQLDREVSNKSYNIQYYNAYSILNKIDQLRAECPVLQPDIICIVESFCRQEISNAELAMGGFQIVCRRDGRDTAMGRGRGLLVYVREGIPAAELQLEGADMVTEYCGGEDIKMILVYRPPEAPGSQADGGNTERLCSLLRRQGRAVVMWDFNMPGSIGIDGGRQVRGRGCCLTPWGTYSGTSWSGDQHSGWVTP